jgi:hypothetical protein
MRFDGVFAPHHELCSRIAAGTGDSLEAPAGEGKRGGRDASMGRAQRMKRAFAIDVERAARMRALGARGKFCALLSRRSHCNLCKELLTRAART